MPKSFGSFSSRFPDAITEELVVVLSGSKAIEFRPLFDLLLVKLRARNAASGGQEMLRLRAYEKLQALVGQGKVAKTVTKFGKEYRGLASLVPALPVIADLPVATSFPIA